MNVFLTAEWRNLINLTFEAPPEQLEALLPKELELDIFEDKAHVSLVAFDFLNTRVKGVKVPFHVNFPEVNLRYYVRYKGHRGVVFIREYVPKHCIAFIAQRFYNEPYVSYPMESDHKEQADGAKDIFYRIWKDKDKFTIEGTVAGEPHTPGPETPLHHFKEHDLGFGRDKKGDTLAYFVEHPVWTVRDIQNLRLDLDFEKLYGPEWGFLNGAQPRYSLFAEGSGIKVFSSLKLRELDERLEMNVGV